MKHFSMLLTIALTLLLLTACGGNPVSDSGAEPPAAPTATTPDNTPDQEETPPPADQNVTGNTISDESEDNPEMTDEIKVKITVGETELTAVFEDNTTSRALVEQMPMTLPMMDLYGREMCYRYGNGTFETDQLRYDRYEVGDIAYWPPAGSLVILYKQNGEEFERQQIGHIDQGVEVFSGIGDVDVTFELMED